MRPASCSIALACAALLALCPRPAPAEAQKDPWDDTRYAIFVGRHTDTRYLQILKLKTDFQASHIAWVGLARRLMTFGDYRHLEAELNVGQHWGMQNHQELNALISHRWRRFPWDHYVDTSLAVGMGLSFASRHPPLEEREEQPPAVRRQAYMMNDIEFSRVENPDLSLFLRIHHRSGIYGLISDSRGSNFVGIGLRSSF
jgi:hypothetical protein